MVFTRMVSIMLVSMVSLEFLMRGIMMAITTTTVKVVGGTTFLVTNDIVETIIIKVLMVEERLEEILMGEIFVLVFQSRSLRVFLFLMHPHKVVMR
jgi:hypothetical protein